MMQFHVEPEVGGQAKGHPTQSACLARWLRQLPAHLTFGRRRMRAPHVTVMRRVRSKGFAAMFTLQ